MKKFLDKLKSDFYPRKYIKGVILGTIAGIIVLRISYKQTKREIFIEKIYRNSSWWLPNIHDLVDKQDLIEEVKKSTSFFEIIVTKISIF